MAKKKQLDQKWIIGGVIAVLAGAWWAWISGGEQAKIALVDENASGGGTVYEMKGGWAYGKMSVKEDVDPALKAWISTLRVTEKDGSALITVDKKKSWCNSVKFSDPKEYSGKNPYMFGLTARISPKGMIVTENSEMVEVAKRKLTVSFLDSRGKVMASGVADVPVLSVVTGTNAPSSLDVGGDDNGNSSLVGLSKPKGADIYKVAVTPAKEFLDKDALKIFKIKYCLDTSNADAVDVELVDMAWLLDTMYIGPAETVSKPVIVY